MTGGIYKQKQISLEITRGHNRAQFGPLYVFKDGSTTNSVSGDISPSCLDEILDTSDWYPQHCAAEATWSIPKSNLLNPLQRSKLLKAYPLEI